MRVRNVKNKEEIINNSKYIVKDYSKYRGKWREYFKNDNPIYIEIGSGKGKFIASNAINFPNINFIGIEKSSSILAKSLMNIPDNINNLAMLSLDALDIDLVFNHDIDKIYLNFSDPWPKARHSSRRLTSSIFLKKYDTIFKNDCIIEMRTDNRNLFEYSLVSFNENNYKIKEISLNLHEDGIPLITTEYEDKFSKKGMNIYYVKCLKFVNNWEIFLQMSVKML